MNWLYVALPVAVILIAAVIRRGSGAGRAAPREPAGPENPQNVSPGVASWRQRRAAAGKGDNWLTRPLIRYDATREHPLQFLPGPDDEDQP